MGKSDKKGDKKAIATAAPSKVKESKKVKADPLQKTPIASTELLKKHASKAKKGKTVKKAKDSSNSSDESSSEEEKPKATQVKAAAKKSAAKSSSSSDSDSEDEKPAAKATKTTPAPKKAGAAAPKKASSDSSSESESDSSSEEAAPSKAAPAKAIPAPSITQASSSSDDSDSDEEVPAAKPAAKVAKKDSDSSDDESDSSTASESAKKAPTKAASKASSSSSDEESDSSSDEDEDGDVKMTAAAPTKAVNGGTKRKAEEEEVSQPKKVKLANGDAAPAENAGEETTTVFVGRLSWSVDNDRLAQEFSHCGEIESATVQIHRDTGKSKGFGYVRFKDVQSMEKALEMNGKEIDGRPINVDKSTPVDKSQRPEKRAKAFGDEVSPPSSTLFVGNLSFGVSEDTVWSFFNDYGVKNVRLPTDRETGRPKGFGYVEFEDVDGATKAFTEKNGSEVEGRPIRLDYSQPRDSSGGGFRGGGFRGGDRGFRGGGGGGFRGGDRGGRGGGFRGGRGGDRGGRGGFDRGGRGGGRGAPRGNVRSGGIAAFEGKKITF